MAVNAVQLGFSLPRSSSNECDESNTPEPLGHQSPHWSDWDGGKIGGRPSWLNPRDLPEDLLRCRGPCGEKSNGKGGKDKEGTALRFITQLYCPADDVTGNASAFHRSLYVFACPKCCSSTPTTVIDEEKSDEEGNNASATTTPETANNHLLSKFIRVLRCQLPKQNDFYPPTGDGGGSDDGDDEDDDWINHTSDYWAKSTNTDTLNLCAVCGQRSRGKCPKQQLWFCCPEHQKECLRASKQQKNNQKRESATSTDGTTSTIQYLPSVCYESELVVEEEPNDDGNASLDTESKNTTKSKSTLFEMPKGDITDADADLEQSDLNALTGNGSLAQAATGVTDPTTLSFYARMAIGGKDNDVRDQCLRYCRWPTVEKSEGNAGGEDDDENVDVGPLWLSSNNRPPIHSTTSAGDSSNEKTSSFPPPCQYCGAPRAFEFQILPQMLHYLLQNPEEEEEDDENKEKSSSRQVLTESQRAILLEAKSKIESGVDLPEGFLEQHKAAVANAREALLGISKDSGNTSVDRKDGLDWGTIAVYTCTASCGDGGIVSGETNGAYREEAAWMQPPLD
mmetsp:Transcript_29418/g.50090  ORF Transcript_29418/g.50090 Transcript_29418/m.50090 type:complete len:566 (+) Transcript_29418:33-1730(+)